MPRIFEAPPGFVLNPDYLVPELRAQRDALLEALRLVQVDCQYLHHEKKDQHALSQPCPVVDRINAAIKAVEGEGA